MQNLTVHGVRARASKAMAKLAIPLLASASIMAISFGTANAVPCAPGNDAAYDVCVGAGDTPITLTGIAVTHDVNITVPTILNAGGGSVLFDAGGFFGAGITELNMTGGSSAFLTGIDPSGFFGLFPWFSDLNLDSTSSLSVTLPGTVGVVFGDASNSAIAGTVFLPTASNFLAKTGTGTLTINNMQMNEGELVIGQGGLAHSSGTANVKGIAVGTGAPGPFNGPVTMTMSGGTLNITGAVSGVPCGSGCPSLRIGEFSGSGTLNQTNGTIAIGGVGVTGSYNVGNQGGDGVHNISGGVLRLGTQADIVNSAGLYGIGRIRFNASDGTSSGALNISGTGLVDVQAGELINGDRDGSVFGGADVSLSTITMTGGTLRVQNGANLWLSAFDNGALIDSIFNLNGGTLEIGDGRLQDNYGGGGGAYEFNLGNGTIKVIDSLLTTSVDAILTGATAATGVKIDTNGIGADWNGDISGAGWLVKTGAGTLTLDGANTYTGGTAFNGGVVLVDAAADLGDNGAGHSFNGGTLQLGANNVLALRSGGTAMVGNGTIDTNGFFSIFDTAISGAGNLTITGGGFIQNGGNSNSHTGSLTVTGNSLYVGYFGQGIGNTSAVTVSAGSSLITAGGAETIGSLAGAGSVTIQDGFTLTTGANNNSTVWSGTIGEAFGVASLTKVGTGTFTVNNNLTYTGLTTVSGGTMIVNGNMSDSLLVAAGARFGGNTNIAGNVTNNGTIAPGNSPGTTAIAGNYTAGVGAVFDMEVIFNSANAPVNGTTHDFVDIALNVTGTTLINVIPFAPSGAPTATTGNGVELVRVGGTVVGTQFALAAPVLQGAYQYVLRHLPNYAGALDGFFLQSQINETFIGEAALFSAGQALSGSCFRDTGSGGAADAGGTGRGRAWVKYSTGNRSTGPDSGIESDQDYGCFSGGADVRVGPNWRVGVAGGFGHTNVDITTLAGLAALEGDGAAIRGLATYEDGNVFGTVSIGHASMDWTFDGPLTAPVNTSTSGLLGGAKVGALWPMGSWQLGASAQIDYEDIGCDKRCLIAGTVADPAKWFGRANLQLEGSLRGGAIRPFVAVSLSDSLDGSNTVTNGAQLTTNTEAAIFGAKAGLSARVAPRVVLFADVGITEGLDADVSGVEGNGGLKFSW